MQLQLPKTGLTMAMTCCDMEDQTQDVNFLPSTPTYDTSDFVFFRTNTDQREFSSAQAMPVQHDYLQTAPSPSGTATRTVQQPGNKPMFSSDSVTTSGQPVPNKHTPVSKITASSSCPAKRDATASPKLPPPVAPRRKLPQHLFAPLSRAVAKSGPVFPPAIPSSASQPSSLLQALMERDAEQRSLEHQMQMQAVTAAFGADLRSVRQGSAPVSSAHALLHKLSMHRGVSCKE